MLIGSNAFELDLPGGRAWRDAFLARSYGANEARARDFYGLVDGRTPPSDHTPERQTSASPPTRPSPARPLVAANGAPVYRYLFDDGRDGRLTAHARELGYIFGEATLNGVSMQDYWARFIRDGTPGGAWPRWPQRIRFDTQGASAVTDAVPQICRYSEAL